MPTQSRGFFTCDFCGVACDTFEEASEHETQCSKRPRPRRYGMAPLSSNELEGYLMHGTPHHGPPKLRVFALMGGSDRGSHLSQEDSIACQSIELFEASPENAADFDAGRSGGIPVVPRQVGLRCAHCATSPMASSSFSTIFPSSLGTLATSIRLIADSHIPTCRMAPPDIRETCDRAAKRREDENEGRNAIDDDERSRVALLDYCVGLCQHWGIVNKQPHKTGITFADGELPPTPAETPAMHRGSYGAPYSGDRMGPPYDHRMFPTPGGPPYSRSGMPPMMGGPIGPGDAIAPTPLQRRRDRPEGAERGPPMYSAERSEGEPPSTGYPTPYSEGRYGHDVQTPMQPNFEGKDGPTPHSVPPSAHGSESSPGYNHYDLPSNFPYYQESDRTWHCKFCSHIHPTYRDPQAIWSSPSGGPPPGNFIDSHLSMCRAYHQSMPSPPMYHGPPYGPPYMPGYPPPWDSHSPPQMPPHMPYPPLHPGEQYPYPPMPPDEYGDRMPRGPPPMGMPPHGPPRPGPQQGPPPVRKENVADVVRNSISHLMARENEYNSRNPDAKSERLVLEEDKLLLTDYFFYLMKQLKLCRFSESDRKTRGGKREKIKIGYGGLQCIHCADIPNSRKFFWSNVDRLANSFAEIPGHVLKCRRCPMQTKEALLGLKNYHPEQMARLPRGSQKVFFRRMWRRLHDEDAAAAAMAEEDEATENTKEDEKPETPTNETPETKSESEKSPAEDSLLLMQRSTKEAAKALADAAHSGPPKSPFSKVLLAIPDDKEWLSDMDCFIRKQLEVFCATEEDVETARSDRKYPVQVGQVGIRCIHCSLKKHEASGTAVAFPFAISGIYEAVREFQRLHLDSCENVPVATKEKLNAFKGASSLSSVLRKYYVLAARALGLNDTREGIRSGAECIPLGSQAAFSFAEGGAEDVRGPYSPPTESTRKRSEPSRGADEPANKKAKNTSPNKTVMMELKDEEKAESNDLEKVVEEDESKEKSVNEVINAKEREELVANSKNQAKDSDEEGSTETSNEGSVDLKDEESTEKSRDEDANSDEASEDAEKEKENTTDSPS